MDLRTPQINNIIDLWINEDIGRGDLTKSALKNQLVSAHWLAKNDGVFCGGEIVKKIFNKIDSTIVIELLIGEGETFKLGDKILRLQGPASALVAGERISLNIAMHLSGIATKTSSLVSKLKSTQIKLADTRKTTPGLRTLEKYAVRCGGGINHRMGLDDAAMLKENHIAWSNGVEESIKKIRKSSPWTTKIIVEAETAEQAKAAVSGGADGVLLDEMDPKFIKELVPKLRELAKVNNSFRKTSDIIIEVSGIDISKINDYTNTDIDIISTSAPITKSTWIDLSMRYDSSRGKV